MEGNAVQGHYLPSETQRNQKSALPAQLTCALHVHDSLLRGTRIACLIGNKTIETLALLQILYSLTNSQGTFVQPKLQEWQCCFQAFVLAYVYYERTIHQEW